jgi:hypothetical protein
MKEESDARMEERGKGRTDERKISPLNFSFSFSTFT